MQKPTSPKPPQESAACEVAATTQQSIASLADKIATRILTLPTGEMCHRIVLKSGTYPNDERDEGGYCRSALEGQIRETLLDSLSFSEIEHAQRAALLKEIWTAIFSCKHTVEQDKCVLEWGGQGKNSAQELRARLATVLLLE